MNKPTPPDGERRRGRGRPSGSWTAEKARERLSDTGVHVHDFDRRKEHRTRKPKTSYAEAAGWGLQRKGPGYALNNDQYEQCAWHMAGGMPPRQAWRLAGFTALTAAQYIQRGIAEHPNFATRVEELREVYNKRGGRLSPEYVMDRLIALATSDIADYVERDAKGRWQVKDLTKLSPAERDCISQACPDKDGNLIYKLHDKVKILEAVARALLGYDRVNVGIDVSFGERLDEMNRRSRQYDLERGARTIDVTPQPAQSTERKPPFKLEIGQEY
jgi:hypothetical protein